ncbi:MAG TPA: BamA/TamA family outer membrane protein [Bdellovibrionota bacterium]|nr:BamA/TamA family outer membrane protein [Bdellovibrionota bacterium]
MLSKGILAWLVVGTVAMPSPAQAYNYPEIEWRTVETKHFIIHYYPQVEWSARKVAVVAEEVYPIVTGIYDYEPKHRTHIVVRDDEDTSNGFAVFNLGWLTIWASPSTLSLRGRHDWIRGVLTHEFSHVVSLQASTGGGYRIEGLRFGGIHNSASRANTDAGGTAYVLTQPGSRWWAEGTAQLDTSAAGYDLWDSMQDTLLRSATLENNLLTFDELHNITVREHFGGEMVYNQGFNFLQWMKETYGQDANVKVTKSAESDWNLDFDKNFSKAIGKSFPELYAEWQKHLKEKYETQVAEIRKAPKEGKKIERVSETTLRKLDDRDRPYADGVFTFYPRFSPDGHWFSVVDRGTLSLRYLDSPFILETPRNEEQEKKEKSKPIGLTLKLGAAYYSWSPDSRQLILSKRLPNIHNGYPYYDLFLAELGPLSNLRAEYLASFRKAATEGERKKITRHYRWQRQSLHIEPDRLTSKLRATHVAWSPDGKSLAFSDNGDGHRNLRLIDPDGKNVRDLVTIGGDAEATEPAWSPDGSSIAFTLFHHDQSDIWIVPAAGGTPKPLTLDAADDRQPVFSADGKEIVFSSDRSGIFQLYRIPMNANPSTSPTAVTNVETGAFMPFAPPDGSELLYSRFSSFGFKAYRIGMGSAPAAEIPAPAEGVESKIRQQLTPDQTFPPLDQSSRYLGWPRPVRVFPSLLWEHEQLKLGLALQAADFLEKHSLTALALFGEEQDYQVQYENDMFYPHISASYTAYIRNDALALFGGTGASNAPESVVRDNIQFIDSGVSKDFFFAHGLRGTHWFSIAYDRRWVDRRIGFPILVNNEVLTDFRLLTNDGMTMKWSYSKTPSQPGRDFDINPRDATYASLSYSLVHTGLFVPDATIPAPNDDYFYHEGTFSLGRYYAMPWEKSWWNRHTFWVNFTGGMKSRDVNINDEFFLGGRLNFRAFGEISSNTLFYGYNDFSISGETMMVLSAGYTFPIARAIDKKWGWIYWDSVFGSLFGEIGNAWTFGEIKNFRQNTTRDSALGQGEVFLEDIGAEFRIKTFLFNDFNRWNSVVRVAYGFQDSAKYGFEDGDSPVRIYIGVGSEF